MLPAPILEDHASQLGIASGSVANHFEEKNNEQHYLHRRARRRRARGPELFWPEAVGQAASAPVPTSSAVVGKPFRKATLMSRWPWQPGHHPWQSIAALKCGRKSHLTRKADMARRGPFGARNNEFGAAVRRLIAGSPRPRKMAGAKKGRCAS